MRSLANRNGRCTEKLSPESHRGVRRSQTRVPREIESRKLSASVNGSMSTYALPRVWARCPSLLALAGRLFLRANRRADSSSKRDSLQYDLDKGVRH